MGNLRCHRANHSETLRLDFGMLQPLSLFDLRIQRGSSALDRLLKIVVRSAERGQ